MPQEDQPWGPDEFVSLYLAYHSFLFYSIKVFLPRWFITPSEFNLVVCLSQDEGSDEDYENPDAEEDDGSGGDYESPTEDVGLEDSDNGYESPPSEAPEEIPHQLRAAKPMADGEYIGTETSIQHCLAVLNSSHKQYMLWFSILTTF